MPANGRWDLSWCLKGSNIGNYWPIDIVPLPKRIGLLALSYTQQTSLDFLPINFHYPFCEVFMHKSLSLYVQSFLKILSFVADRPCINDVSVLPVVYVTRYMRQ